MSAPLLSTYSFNVIQDSTENDPTLKDVSSRTKRDFVHFIRDFGVLETAVGFIIASVLLDFIKSLVNYTVFKYIGTKNLLLNNSINLVLIIILLFIFIRYVFYTYIYTDDIAKEELLKKAISEKKLEIVKNKFDKNSLIKDSLKKSTDVSAITNELYKESFTPKNAFAGINNGYNL